MSNEAEEFKRAGLVCQIFSAAAFAGLFVWLAVTNGRKITDVRKEPEHKRIEVVVNICIFVAMISSFCNLFQITEADDNLIPRQDNYVVDMARPIEWILTCPPMQLALVLLGGEKFPEYRLFLMPGFSLLILSFGTITQIFAEIAFVWVFFCFGFVTFCVMISFNRKQISEYSDGKECITQGTSKFRTASLILMFTWLPFPIWFALSPEGAGLIQDVIMIQGGWAFFNIASKFILIFYIQSIKEEKTMEEKVKRQLTEDQDAEMNMKGVVVDPVTKFSKVYSGSARDLTGDLRDVIEDCADQLKDPSEQMSELLAAAGINTKQAVLLLNEESATAKGLPWDFISMLQKNIEGGDGYSYISSAFTGESKNRTFDSGFDTICTRALQPLSPQSMSPRQRKDQDLLTAMTSLIESKHNELMQSVRMAQNAAERSEAKMQTCTEFLERATGNIVHEHGSQLEAVRQQIEAQHTAQFHHQSDFAQMQVRKLECLASDVEKCQKTVDEMFQFHANQLKTDTSHEELLELRTKVYDLSADTIRAVHEMGDKIMGEKEMLHSPYRFGRQSSNGTAASITDPEDVVNLIKPQFSILRESMAELRGSWNFALEGMLSKMTKNFDAQTNTITTTIQSATGDLVNNIGQRNEKMNDNMYKKMREVEDHMQVSINLSSEQLGGKLNFSTESIMDAIKSYTEKAASQITLTSSTLGQANSYALREQMANFHEEQLRQQGHMEKKLKGDIEASVHKAADTTAEKMATLAADLSDPMMYMGSSAGNTRRGSSSRDVMSPKYRR